MHNDPAPEVWEEVYKEGLKRVSIWCMEGPPRVLQGWCEKLGPTLESLELGVRVESNFHPSTTGIATDHGHRDAPATPRRSSGVLAVLPKLKVLDTEYLPSFGRTRPSSSSSTPPPALETLTVRTSSSDVMGSQKLWPWILELIPGPAASLHTFSHYELSRVHGATLKQVILGDAMLTLGDIECLYWKVDMIKKALGGESSLRSLTLHIDWIVGEDGQTPSEPFTLQTAREWMLRSADSSLRHIAINDRHYIGEWFLQDTSSEHAQSETGDGAFQRV
ncbi:hypothetical protein DFP72DRAFT_1076107 [Ephemerocybe angulata]|uniref:Uncharacterized protein n=1 Tax=Ephemerocybe angulata TaxID=980116 RepID=A0A8H6M007_9AGAR|nr:hypothetical protein DFP72DRAFT_1076107 [Tulosesus angulatus]